jgi:hypothetical protein
LVASWGNQQDYRYFLDEFGLGEPRVVARYPKKWERVGGIMFGIGLDDDDDAGGQTDDLHILDREQYELRWQQYASDTPAFELAEQPIEIIGSATRSTK